MVVVMEERASEDQIQHIIATLVDKGFDVHRSTGALRSVLGAVGGNRSFDTRLIEVMDTAHAARRPAGRYPDARHRTAARQRHRDHQAVMLADAVVPHRKTCGN